MFECLNYEGRIMKVELRVCCVATAPVDGVGTTKAISENPSAQ